MTRFDSAEARIEAETGAVIALFNYAAEPVQYTETADDFVALTEATKHRLELGLQGLARLLPDAGVTVYDTMTHHSPYRVDKAAEITGPEAYDTFIKRHDLFTEDDFHTPDYEGTSPFLIVHLPGEAFHSVHAFYSPDDFGQDYLTSIETDSHTERGDRNAQTELFDNHATFLVNTEADYAQYLILSGQYDEKLLDGIPVTPDALAESLRNEKQVSAVYEGGLFGLGSYLVWRSVRDLYEATEFSLRTKI